MEIRIITTDSPLYAQEKELRQRLLRQPLGLIMDASVTRGEKDQIHMVMLDREELVA